MDAFKVSEVKRMQLGGNKPWVDFFDNHQQNQLEGRTFEDSTIKDRYDGEIGEEWKERLSAKVEGREYVPGATPAPVVRQPAVTNSGPSSRSQTPSGFSNTASARSATPLGGKKAQNEAYFSRMGADNAARPADLHPSQGGKFAGFGSEPAPVRSGNGDLLGELQKDPLAGLIKGFGWLGKSAKTGYEGYVKPGVQKVRSRTTHFAFDACS